MSFDDLRVVGFEGDFGDACGYTFPIVRHVGRNQYFDLSIEEASEVEGTTGLREAQIFASPEDVPEPDFIYSESEMNDLFEEGSLIRLPEEVRAFPDVVVAYVSEQFLDAIEQQDLSSVIPERNLEWHRLSGEEGELWVTCASEKVVVDAFEQWARFLMQKCSRLLVDFFHQHGQDIFQLEARFDIREIGDLCNVALTAAQDNTDLKSRIYLLYGVTLLNSEEPEPLYNLYSGFVLRDFTTEDGRTLWDRETFYEQVRSVAYRLRILAEMQEPLPSLASSPLLDFTDEEKDYSKSIDSLVKKVKNDILLVKEYDGGMRRAQAQRIAERWRHDLPAGPRVIERFMQEMESSLKRESFWVVLDYDFIIALAGEPAFYLHTYNERNLDQRTIHVEHFRTTIENLIETGGKLGPLAKQLMTPKAVPAGANT